MHNIRSAYHQFWSQFINRIAVPTPRPVPAFQVGTVEFRDARGNLLDVSAWPASAWPHITYEVVKPKFRRFTISTVHVWDRNIGSPNFFTRVDDILQQINEAIPEGQERLLDLGCDGQILLQQSNPFIGYRTDPGSGQFVTPSESLDVQHGIASIVIRNYVL